MRTERMIVCVCVALYGAATPVVSQSMFELNNGRSDVNAPVFNASGIPLAGSTYLAELWGGPTPDSLIPARAAYAQDRVIVPFYAGGFFRDDVPGGRGYSTIDSVRPYVESAWLQVRAWDSRLGATYEDVVAAGLGGYGESPIFSAVGSNPYLANPDIPYPLIGLQSFSLRAEVPEPSTWILLAFGGFGLWWAVWRQRR